MFGLPKALLPIYLIVFLDVLGLTILIPLLPALAQKLHSTPAVMGAAISVTAVWATLSSPVWGRLSDKVSRKTVLQYSQCFSLVGFVLLALTNNLWLLFISRSIEGLGGGNLGVAQSYIADETKPDQREKAFAFSAAAFGIGFVIGPTLAGQLLRIDVSVPFWVAAALQAANLVITHLFLEKTEAKNADKVDTKAIVGELKKRPMLNVMGRQFLYIFSFTYFFTIFSLYLQREMNMPPETSSLFLAVAGAVGAVMQIFAIDRLNKRFGEFILSEAAFALGFVAFAAMFFIGHSIVIFVAILVVWAISGSALRPTLNKLIADRAPEEQRGAILGFADSLNNFSMIVAPAAGGIILGFAPVAIGVLPAIAIAGAFVLGLFGKKPERHKDQQQPASAAAPSAA
ncbi:MAG: MFS transporter [Candidatus Eremiobacteraeota bacterium]|nr:MFS transporter [Candidatus Eremiobacteraeota bacterium]MBC5824316.1 MFS transporter [Candidatus Eremiobacteraeota bacterium]